MPPATQPQPDLFVPDPSKTPEPTIQLVNHLSAEIIKRNTEIHRLQLENELILKSLFATQKKLLDLERK